MVVGRKWVMKRWVDGMPSKDDFEIVSEELGSCGEGEVVFEALFCSVDPYQRAYSRRMQPPFTMFGFQASPLFLELRDIAPMAWPEGIRTRYRIN